MTSEKKPALQRTRPSAPMSNPSPELPKPSLLDRSDTLQARRFDDFADSINGWFWETDDALRITFVAGRSLELTGMDAAALTECSRTELLAAHGEPADTIRRHTSQLTAQTPYCRFNYVWRRPDGARISLQSSAQPYFDARGRFLGYRGIDRDITPQTDAETRAREAHQILLQAIENMSDGFILIDDRDRFMLCNSRYREMYPEVNDLLVAGTPLDEIIRTYAERVPTYPDRAASDAFIEERMSHWHGGASMLEVTPGGRWIETRDQSIATGHRVGIRIDVTDRRLAEQALRDSEDRYRTLVEYAPEAIVVFDVDERRFVDANENAARLFNTDRQTLLRYGPIDLSPLRQPSGERSAERARRHIEDALAGGAPLFDWTHITVDGREVPCEVRLVRLPASGQRLVRGSITNVSDARRAQRALADKTKQLEVTLDYMDQGLSMFDGELKLVFMNDRATALLDLPPDTFKPGDSLESILRRLVENGEYGEGDVDELVRTRMALTTEAASSRYRHVRPDGRVLEVRRNALPDGGFVVTDTDVTETERLSEQLSYQATHDQLTGLVNRWEFDRRLRRVIESADADGSQHALCYLDLDQFKVINDTCGHAAGDALLQQLGAMLPDRVRRRDTFARLGGDEFGVLMEHCSIDQAQQIAEKLRRSVEDFQFGWEERRFKLSVSIGVVQLVGGMDASDVMSTADAACYTAKDKGRNRIHVHRPDDEELTQLRGEMQWVSRINAALEDGRMHLYCQPIVPLAHVDTRIEPGSASLAELHFEVLLRMEDEHGELTAPGAFLPAAERYNLAVRLDMWVIEQVFAWFDAKRAMLGRLEHCAINLSGSSLGDGRITDRVLSLLDDSPIRPEQLCFEVTETAAIGHLAGAKRFVERMNALGCHFALDDFGSGLSSFNYLKTLPVDYVKIDGAFVQDIHTDSIDLALVESINDIGHIMGKRTIAESVENDAVLEKLREIGVDYVQGYALCRPFPLSELL